MKDKRSKTSAINGKLGGRPKELFRFKALPNENWRPIKGFKKYLISDHGRVMSLCRNRPLIRKHEIDKDGYKRISLYIGNNCFHKTMHRLVLEAYKGPCPDGCESSHINNDRTNNHIGNLTWETHRQNLDRKKEHGTFQRGERHGMTKLSNVQVANIKKSLKRGALNQRQIAYFAGVSSNIVSNIKTGKTWKHITI